jgi:hypothetical protein
LHGSEILAVDTPFVKAWYAEYTVTVAIVGKKERGKERQREHASLILSVSPSSL